MKRSKKVSSFKQVEQVRITERMKIRLATDILFLVYIYILDKCK